MKRAMRVSLITVASYVAMLLPAYAEGTGNDPSYRKGRLMSALSSDLKRMGWILMGHATDPIRDI